MYDNDKWKGRVTKLFQALLVFGAFNVSLFTGQKGQHCRSKTIALSRLMAVDANDYSISIFIQQNGQFDVV